MEIGLGTVQFGIDYGVSNPSGKTPANEVQRILDFAQKKSIHLLDTASVYGASETVLGCFIPQDSHFKIVTKTSPLKDTANTKKPEKTIREGFQQSLKRLNQKTIYGLLVHHAEDLLSRSGRRIWSELQLLKDKGLVERIGVSVYSGEQIERIVDQFMVDIVQLPINVFDQRLITGGQLDQLKKNDVEIHARSAFLQGLLCMDPNGIPSYFKPIRKHLDKWHRYIRLSNLSPTSAALAFFHTVTEVDAVLIGVNDKIQLQKNLRDFHATTAVSHSMDFADFALNDPAFVNPANWRL